MALFTIVPELCKELALVFVLMAIRAPIMFKFQSPRFSNTMTFLASNLSMAAHEFEAGTVMVKTTLRHSSNPTTRRMTRFTCFRSEFVLMRRRMTRGAIDE
jgi:hypothetical protein